MTTKKSTKKALLMSALSLLLCMSMLIGTTFAWFTDSVSTGVNMIQSGTLDVDMVDAAGESLNGKSMSFMDVNGNTDILWEPNATFKLESFQVVNKGNLALKYDIVINGLNGDAKLLEAIEFYYVIGESTEKHALVNNGAAENTLLEPGKSSEMITVYGHMLAEAGNEYQDLTLEGISLTIYATQVTYENDYMGDTYDADAEYIYLTPAIVTNHGEKTVYAESLFGGGQFQHDVALDAAFTFKAPHDGETAADLAYGKWQADYVVTSNVDLEDGDLILAGQYNANSANWQAFYTPAVAANTPTRLLGSTGYGDFFTYEAICNLVQTFNCGLANVSAPAGTTITVQLCLFETDNDGNVIDQYYLANYAYTFTSTAANTAEDLAEALTAGGEVKLTADIALGDTQLTVPAGSAVTLDLNGYDLTGAYSGAEHYAMFTVKDGGSLTINGEGVVSAETETSENNRSLALFMNAGDLTLNGGTYKMVANTVNKTWVISTLVDNRTSNSSCTTSLTINGGDYSISGSATNLFRNYPQQGGSATLTINGGVFHANPDKATTYIWNQEAGNYPGMLYFYGGTYDGNIVYEDYNGQSDVYVAPGVTIQPYSGNT